MGHGGQPQRLLRLALPGRRRHSRRGAHRQGDRQGALHRAAAVPVARRRRPQPAGRHPRSALGAPAWQQGAAARPRFGGRVADTVAGPPDAQRDRCDTGSLLEWSTSHAPETAGTTRTRGTARLTGQTRRHRGRLRAAEGRRKKPRSFWKELPILIGVALLLTLLIQTFIARVFVIPSESMEQTLHGCPGCYGDRVLVDKLVYRFGDPEPGEVVVFERPDTWNQSEFSSNRSSNGFVSWLQDVGAAFGLASPNEDDVVKRIVAVGGQTRRVLRREEPGAGRRRAARRAVHLLDARRRRPRSRSRPSRCRRACCGCWATTATTRATRAARAAAGEPAWCRWTMSSARCATSCCRPSRWRGVGDHNPQVSAPRRRPRRQFVPLGLGPRGRVPDRVAGQAGAQGDSIRWSPQVT